MYKRIIISVLVFYVLIWTHWGQSEGNQVIFIDSDSLTNDSITSKKIVTPEDYKLWDTMNSSLLSDDGLWYSYYIYNENSKVWSLYVGATQSKQTYTFPKAMEHQFNSGSEWFACLVPEKGLGLLNLKTGSIDWIHNVLNFRFSLDGNYLIYKQGEPATVSQSDGLNLESGENLVIDHLKTRKSSTIKGIQDYMLSPDTTSLVYTSMIDGLKTVSLRAIGSLKSTIITQNKDHDYKCLTWNESGTAIAFFQELSGITEGKTAHAIYCYNGIKSKPKRYYLKVSDIDSLFKGRRVINKFFKIKFSPKGSSLYFKVHGDQDRYTDHRFINGEVSGPELWKSSDKELYPRLKNHQKNKFYGARLARWNPETGSVMLLESQEYPNAIISPNGKYLIAYDPLLYEPSFTVNTKQDYYITDLETETTELFLEAYAGQLYFSPESHYINYFNDKHWWVYDLEKREHTNITKDLPVSWHKDFPKYPHKNGLKPYGFYGWITGDKALLVYDKYDVWLISSKGKAKKLTNGRVSQISHRICNKYALKKDDLRYHHKSSFFEKQIKEAIDLTEGLVFETLGYDYSSGYSIWKPGKQTEIIVYKNMRLRDLRKATHDDRYTYVEESFSISPRISYIKHNQSSSKVLKTSNDHQEEFYWGEAELIHYKSSNGESLRGALFYPANYKKGQKHPMIVSIYERRSGSLHRYKNPSMYTRDRLNTTNYTLDGYFVFLPDISYTLNDVGMSAVRCVEAGVNKVLEKGNVDADRIGLEGHSFGGYETNFIITKSKLFAAAVSGAGKSDIIGSYHGIFNGKNKMLRFEDWQYAFKDSFYSNPETYIENSPLHHAADIDTPLLLWAGKDDGIVDYKQSLAMYMGLRRLNKTCELILYPEDVHNIKKEKYQIDLTWSIKKWFNKYLKNH